AERNRRAPARMALPGNPAIAGSRSRRPAASGSARATLHRSHPTCTPPRRQPSPMNESLPYSPTHDTDPDASDADFRDSKRSHQDTRVFVVANQKGGVGKTTTTVNLAAALARHGQRTLLVDLDPQGNATMGSGIDKRTLKRTIYQVLIGLSDVVEATQWSEGGRYAVLPANRELAGAEVELVDFEERETRLKDALRQVDAQYDFILIDCPPSLSLLTLNGFCAAHGVIIPMQCEYFALEGLSDLVNTIKKVHANFNTDLQIIGLLRVMFDPRVTLGQQVSAQLEQHFGDKGFRTVIPRNVRLAEAPSYGLPGLVFDPQAKGARAYLECGAELIERVRAIDEARRAAGRGAGLGVARAGLRPAGQRRGRLPRIRRRADRARTRERRGAPRRPPPPSRGRPHDMRKPRPNGLGRGLEALLGGHDDAR